jgi:hypothetical protein
VKMNQPAQAALLRSPVSRRANTASCSPRCLAWKSSTALVLSASTKRSSLKRSSVRSAFSNCYQSRTRVHGSPISTVSLRNVSKETPQPSITTTLIAPIKS